MHNKWLYTTLVDTANVTIHTPPRDPFEAADNQIHGEMALLMYFLISYGHDLMSGTGRCSEFLMHTVLMDMRNILHLMGQLTGLEGDLWQKVVIDMPRCTHEPLSMSP